jgi:hypothetical protein
MKVLLPLTTALLLTSLSLPAAERTLTPEQLEALAGGDDLAPKTPDRPGNLVDLTKGDLPPKTTDNPWTLGPTGIVGMWTGRFAGDQIEVTAVAKGSAADGKLRWGDVILGVAGKKFTSGGQNMGMQLGNAIIEAERAVNGGKLTLIVWRDSNFIKRNARRTSPASTSTTCSTRPPPTTRSTNGSRTRHEEARERAARTSRTSRSTGTSSRSTLDAGGPAADYSDTSPYDCPKAAKILENAWKVLEKQFIADPKSGVAARAARCRRWPWSPPASPSTASSCASGSAARAGSVWHPPTGEDEPLPHPRQELVHELHRARLRALLRRDRRRVRPAGADALRPSHRARPGGGSAPGGTTGPSRPSTAASSTA